MKTRREYLEKRTRASGWQMPGHNKGQMGCEEEMITTDGLAPRKSAAGHAVQFR